MRTKTKDPNKIGILEKLGFMGFSTSANIAFNFKSMYYLIFLDVVLGIGTKWAGIILTIGTIWDAINDPLIALFCENHKFKSGEKIRPYALICSVPWAISIVLLFTNFGFTSKTWATVIAIVIYFIFEALYTFLCMPYNSMASLATRDDYQRASINAFRSLGGCIGSGIGAVAILPLVHLFGGMNDHKTLEAQDATSIFWVAVVMGVLCIAGSLFHYFTTKERVKPISNEETKRPHISLFKAYKMLFKCKSWCLNMVYIIGYALISAFMMNNVTYYAKYILHDSDKGTIILAFYLVVAILVSVFGPMLDKKMGRKFYSLVSLGVTTLTIIPFIIFPTSLVCVCILAVGVGFGVTSTFIILNTNRNNCSDILEVQNGMRIDSLVAGGDNLITKLAEAGAILLMTSIYSWLGMDSTLAEQPDAVKTAIILFLGAVCLGVTILTGVVAFFIDTKKEYAKECVKHGIPLPTEGEKK